MSNGAGQWIENPLLCVDMDGEEVEIFVHPFYLIPFDFSAWNKYRQWLDRFGGSVDYFRLPAPFVDSIFYFERYLHEFEEQIRKQKG